MSSFPMLSRHDEGARQISLLYWEFILLDGFGPVPFLSSWDWEEKRTEEKGNA